MPFELTTNSGDMPMAVLMHEASGATVHVHLQGAHVERWVTGNNAAPLYTSPDTAFKPGKAIRGGVPVCWPQFSDMGPCKASHGYARVSMWEVVGGNDDNGNASLVLRLPHPGDAPEPYNKLEVTFIVTLGGPAKLHMELRVKNPTAEAVEFTTALHTYFAVSDISNLRVEGVLDTVPYADNLEDRAMKQPGEIRVIKGETDRNYYGTRGQDVHLTDLGTGAVTMISASGLDDTVLWNPWIEKAKRLADLPDDGYKSFVCVESAAIDTKAKVPAGGEWRGSQSISHLKGSPAAKI